MAVVERNRSLFDRLLGRNKPAVSRRHVVGTSGPLATWSISTNASPTVSSRALQVRHGKFSWLLVVGGLAAGIGAAMLWKFGSQIKVPNHWSLGSLTVPALIWMAVLWKLQSYARRFIKMTLNVGSAPPQTKTNNIAQFEFSLGRGLMTYLASMVILIMMGPAIQRILTLLGLGSSTLSGWLSTIAIVALIWHRHGTPPWRRAASG